MPGLILELQTKYGVIGLQKLEIKNDDLKEQFILTGERISKATYLEKMSEGYFKVK